MYMLLHLFNTFAASQAANCARHNSFLGLKTWYAYFPNNWFGESGGSACDINSEFSNHILGAQSGLLLIALAILDDLIRIAALVAVGYVIYGGIQYVTSNGSPEATSKARSTIINALIGLGIAVIAASVVSFIGTKLGNV